MVDSVKKLMCQVSVDFVRVVDSQGGTISNISNVSNISRHDLVRIVDSQGGGQKAT